MYCFSLNNIYLLENLHTNIKKEDFYYEKFLSKSKLIFMEKSAIIRSKLSHKIGCATNYLYTYFGFGIYKIACSPIKERGAARDPNKRHNISIKQKWNSESEDVLAGDKCVSRPWVPCLPALRPPPLLPAIPIKRSNTLKERDLLNIMEGFYQSSHVRLKDQTQKKGKIIDKMCVWYYLFGA